MPIPNEILQEKLKNCIAQLDSSQNCTTCSHEKRKKPCDECFDEILGMPVNPTKWKSKVG